MSEPEHSMRANNLEELLDLEELDRDLYRAHNPVQSFTPHLFGGQVAAQALRAAALTVPEGRFPHSLHGYFLRRGEADIPTIMRVERDRDGRSFSARHVVALQHGEAIFTASASFHVDEESGDYCGHPLPPDVPGPTAVTAHPMGESTVIFEAAGLFPEAPDREGHWRPARRFWARTREPLPDDRVIHACGLVYLSDMSTGFAELEVPNLPPGGPSLDHAIWFHRSVRADDWLYTDLEPISAAGARGLYQGWIHDRDGRLGATMVQETLLRPASTFTRADQPAS
jgi:acyl-CoA thioesterase II